MKKLQNVINDAIVEKLKWEYRNARNPNDTAQYSYIIQLLPYDELRPNYRRGTMDEVFKDPSGEEILRKYTI